METPAGAQTRPRLPLGRFHLRTLFVLVAMVCLGLGAVSRQLGIVRHRQAALIQLEVTYDASAAFDDRTWDAVSSRGFELVRAADSAARVGRVRALLGDRHVNEVLLRKPVPPDALGLLEAFPEAAFYDKPPPGARNVPQLQGEVTR